MGYGYWTTSDWASYSSTHISSKSTVSGSTGIYSSSSVKADFDPKNIEKRECRDSNDHPNTTPIIVGLDVTGSMGPVLSNVAKKLNILVENILDKKPVSDPSIMFMGIGDADYDHYPLQVTQFESDVRIAEQLTEIYFERGGGSNDHESYNLPYFFAKNYVQTDAFTKGRKGYIFTMGDECCPKTLTPKQVKKVFGIDMQEEISTEALINALSENWNVYHLVIEEGNFYSGRYRDHDGPKKIEESWTPILGQNLVYVDNCENIPEIIVSILEADNGRDTTEILKDWDGSTAISVQYALKNMTVKNSKDSGLVEF